MKTLLSLFRRRQFTLGPQVFRRRTWLTKQVDEAMWKRHFHLD